MIPRAVERRDGRRGRCEGARRDGPQPGDRGEPPREGIAPLYYRDARGDRLNPVFQIAELTGKQVERRAGCIRHVLRCVEQTAQVMDAFRDHDAELGEMGADRVHRLGPLADQEVPRLVIEQRCLPLGTLDRNEAHRRARHRLADRFRINRVVFAPLHIGFT